MAHKNVTKPFFKLRVKLFSEILNTHIYLIKNNWGWLKMENEIK